MTMNYISRRIGSLVFVAILCLMLPSFRAEAASGYTISSSQRFGIGLQGGTVSGLSLKYFMSQGTALQIGVGGSPWGVGVNLELLFHPILLTNSGAVTVPVYIGVGAGMGNWDHGYWGNGSNAANLNVHIPLGVAFQLHVLPIDIFFQLEPGFAVVPDFSMGMGATLGGRIFF